MLNVNIGGARKWRLVNANIRANWKILDIVGSADYVFNLNTGERLPFADSCVDNYYMSNTLEHVRHYYVLFILEEMRRTLKDGGNIRIVVPNIELSIQKYIARDVAWQSKSYRKRCRREWYPDTFLGSLIGYFYNYPKYENKDGHHMAFDSETLFWYVRKSGFVEIKYMKYGKHSAVFNGMDFERHKKSSLYIEAKK